MSNIHSGLNASPGVAVGKKRGDELLAVTFGKRHFAEALAPRHSSESPASVSPRKSALQHSDSLASVAPRNKLTRMARRCPYACDELNGHAAQTDRQLKQQKEQLYRFQLEKDQRAKEALSQQARASQASSNNSAAYSAPQGAVYEEVYRGVETPTSFARYRSKPLS
eukprot:3076-Heterococcus_DN1.PRE.1